MSGTGLPPLWSPAQQSWLQAMGYTVFVDGQIEEVAAAVPIALSVAAAAPAPEQALAPAREPAVPAAAPPRRSAPRSVDADADAHPDAPAAAPVAARERAPGGRRPAVRMPDRLQIALLRASGCNPAEPETQALMASWNLDALRGSAAAKRALWPQLRALRKRGRG